MKKTSNSVIIKSGEIEVIEPEEPVRYTFLMILFIFGIQGFFSSLKYIETDETGHLFIASFSLSLFVLAILKEMFLVTYKKLLNIDEVSAIKIQPILFGRGTVFLEFKVGKKTRQVLLAKEKAKKVHEELSPLLSHSLRNHG